MIAEAPPPSSRDVGKGFGLSLALHLALASAILVKALVFPSAPIPILPSLRVDIVGLPDILKQDLAKTPPVPATHAPAPVAPPKLKEKPVEDELVLKPTKKVEKHREKNLKSALDRIKALERISEDVDADKSKKSGVLIKGNKISKGTSLSGEARETDQATYYDALRDQLQSHWELPLWIARQNLSAQVQITIDRSGRVRNFKFVKSSGNGQFDDAVKKAIAQSDPFPPPPQSIASTVQMNGVLVGFPL